MTLSVPAPDPRRMQAPVEEILKGTLISLNQSFPLTSVTAEGATTLPGVGYVVTAAYGD